MSMRKRLTELGEHFRVPQGTKNMREWSQAIKKAARAEHESIEVLYDRVIAKKAPVTIEGKAVEVKPSDSKPEEGRQGEVKVEGAAQRVEVQAPVINVNIPAPTVHASYGNGKKPWIYTVERIGSHVFTLLAGAMLGVLLAKKLLPVVGLS